KTALSNLCFQTAPAQRPDDATVIEEKGFCSALLRGRTFRAGDNPEHESRWLATGGGELVIEILGHAIPAMATLSTPDRLVANGHRTDPRARGMKDGICNGGRNPNYGRLASADRGKVFPIQQNRRDPRHIAEARDLVLRKTRVEHLAIFETHLLAQRS